MTRLFRGAAAIVVACSLAAPAIAATPRELLLRAAFVSRDKPQALTLIDEAMKGATAQLAANPNDREAKLQQALAIGYRGQLSRSLGDAKTAHAAFEALAAADPRNPETQTALAGWHLTAVSDLGPFLARTMLGANKAVGIGLLDRAVALGGGRAFFPAYAALIRIRVDSGDVSTALALAQRAVAAPAPTPLDHVLQAAAQKVLVPLRAGDGDAASKLAKQLLPFGQLK